MASPHIIMPILILRFLPGCSALDCFWLSWQFKSSEHCGQRSERGMKQLTEMTKDRLGYWLRILQHTCLFPVCSLASYVSAMFPFVCISGSSWVMYQSLMTCAMGKRPACLPIISCKRYCNGRTKNEHCDGSHIGGHPGV